MRDNPAPGGHCRRTKDGLPLRSSGRFPRFSFGSAEFKSSSTDLVAWATQEQPAGDALATQPVSPYAHPGFEVTREAT
jgi:hypothetical protein